MPLLSCKPLKHIIKVYAKKATQITIKAIYAAEPS